MLIIGRGLLRGASRAQALGFAFEKSGKICLKIGFCSGPCKSLGRP